ncbi:MAG: DUF4430 domain-containing protein [Defluviitaleaceae bacterium]|nr:DUF4430 domain-containing protein [Defluviitaleaceae bacterium]
MKKYTFGICIAIIAVAAIAAATFLLNQAVEPTAASFTVTLSVRADALVDNIHLLDREKHELVPYDGVIFPETIIRIYDGDSVFDVTQREMRNAGIHMVSSASFVEGIGNLFMFDAGPMSGWLYLVNGESGDVGPGQYILSPGDIIEWEFTIDFSEGW